MEIRKNKHQNHGKRKPIRFPTARIWPELLKSLDAEAGTRGISRGQMLEEILKQRYRLKVPAPQEIARRALSMVGE